MRQNRSQVSDSDGPSSSDRRHRHKDRCLEAPVERALDAVLFADLVGIAVNLAARVMGEARPGEIVVSSTVVDTSIGGTFGFEPLEGAMTQQPALRDGHPGSSVLPHVVSHPRGARQLIMMRERTPT